MKTIISLLTLLIAIPHAGAALIANYNFNSGSTPYADVVGTSGLTAGDITPGTQMDAGDVITTSYSSEGAASYAIAGSNVSAGSTTTSISWGNAQTNGLYFEFTLTPDGGQTLNLTSIELDVAYRDTNKYRLAVTSSLTGFNYGDQLTITTENPTDAGSIANILQSDQGGISVIPSGTDKDWGVAEGTVIDLSSSTFQNISSAVTFRIYGFLAGSTGAQDALFYDDIQVNGSVIPEPTSFALLLGSLALLLTLGRRKK